MKHKIKTFLILVTISFLLLSSSLTSAVTTTKNLVGPDGSSIDFSATLATLELEDGDHTLTIRVELDSIGTDTTGVKEIRVDYKVGNYVEHYVEFPVVILTTPSSSISKNATIQYNQAWGDVDLELKIEFTASTSLGSDVDAYSDWLVFFTVGPVPEDTNFNILFVMASLMFIGVIVILRKKK